MSGEIFLIRGEDDLVEMSQQPYESEDLLQTLLEKHPTVLAGDQSIDKDPQRLLLIKREAPVPSEEEGSGRWSVDHLFVNQDAVPIIVEVKRSSDTRIRREVVGQMLDYAANGVVYWPVDELRSYFEADCEARDVDPGEELGEFLGAGVDIEAFWGDFRTNLQAGRVRLVFVADELPSELQRVIEFLNKQMNPAEVIGIEIRQYIGEGLRTLVPHVVGQSAEIRGVKGQARGRTWDKARFFGELRELGRPDYVDLATDLLTFGPEATGRPVDWGTGKNRGSFTAALNVNGKRKSLFSVYTDGFVSINIGWAYDLIGTNVSEKYRLRASEELGFDFERAAWERGWPRAPMDVLDGDGLAAFKQLTKDALLEVEEIMTTLDDNTE